jgi:uncharacterized phage protein gp47/JayE
VAFEGRSRDTIRDELLAYLRAEYAAASPSRTLLTSRGSPDWLNASALAVMLEGLEAQAEQNTRDILPDQASDEALARHGYVYGVDRRTGVAAQLTVTVTGTPSATITIAAGTTMTWTDGTLYLVTSSSVTLSVGGSGTINVSATTTGASTTRTVADVLTFSSAPSGLNATGAVASVVTPGADQETTQAWAQRIVDRLRFRPGAGNDADWREWAFQYLAYDIREVWVYPRLQPPASYPGSGTPGVLGCVTVVVGGPPQGDTPSSITTRVIGGTSGAELPAVKEYINGTRNALGLPVSNGEQLRPVTMSPADVSIEALTTQNQAVAATVTMNSANAYSFNFTATIDATSTMTSLVLNGNYTTGATDLEDEAVLVNVGTSTYRGGYYRVVLPAGTFGGGNTTFNLTATPLPAAPTGTLYPAPANWSAIRLAVFNFFDALGPGDTPSPIRFPTEDYSARATLYKQALAAAIMAVPGVLNATVTTPASDTTPTRKTVLDLTTLLVTQ